MALPWANSAYPTAATPPRRAGSRKPSDSPPRASNRSTSSSAAAPTSRLMRSRTAWPTGGSVPGWCLSPEQANVTGAFVNQQQSWRLESDELGSGVISCAQGNSLSLSGQEDHARFWNQPIRGSKYGAWFASASYETLCVNLDNTMQPAKNYSNGKLLLFELEGRLWHCIDGSQGSLGADGYDPGAQSLVISLQAAGSLAHWDVNVQTIQAPAGTGEGHAL